MSQMDFRETKHKNYYEIDRVLYFLKIGGREEEMGRRLQCRESNPHQQMKVQIVNQLNY